MVKSHHWKEVSGNLYTPPTLLLGKTNGNHWRSADPLANMDDAEKQQIPCTECNQNPIPRLSSLHLVTIPTEPSGSTQELILHIQ
jgi:hypothetical protein